MSGVASFVAAPVRIAFTHVHSMRLASGAEALAARVVLHTRGHGFGFSLGMDPAPARDMAAWDAHARSRALPLWRVLGRRTRARVPLVRDEEPALVPDWETARRALAARHGALVRVDPFAWGSLDAVQTVAAAAARFGSALALLAPNAHPWEIAWCAALAGESDRVIVRRDPPAAFAASPEEPGIGVNWSLEPSFASIPWLDGPGS